MPNKPMFSIVTCTWNSAATLGDTLASVASQTCRDIEHIFVDGGSSDATLDMIDAYRGNKRVLRGVSGGISRAMNEGIAHARGEYVAHLHSDDYYFSDEVLAAVAACFAAAQVDWMFGNIQVLKDGVLQAPNKTYPFSYPSLAAGKAFVPHPAAFVRRRAFERVGVFDERLRYAMDIDLWLRLGAVARPAILGQTIAVFREHAGSVSSANKLAARQEEFAVRRRHMRKAPLAFAIFCLRNLKRMAQLRHNS